MTDSQCSSAASRVILGDCRRVLPTLCGEEFNVAITSPPYWGLRSYGGEGSIGSEDDLASYLLALESVFSVLRERITSDGSLWLVVGDSFTSGNRRYRALDRKSSIRALEKRPRTPSGMKPKDLIGLPWELAKVVRSVGWYLRSEIIWSKPNAIPESVCDRPNRSHETVFLFSRSKRYYFDKKAQVDYLKAAQSYVSPSVWSFKVGGDRANHSAPFPIALSNACLAATAKPGMKVIDPFCGSGTVGISSAAFGCSFLGIDSDEVSVKTSLKRIGFGMREPRLHLPLPAQPV